MNKRSLRAATSVFFGAVACWQMLPAAQAQARPSIQRAQILRSQNQVEIEIEASDRVVPQTHLIGNPDRIVVDFVNAVPGRQLRGLAINRGEVKSLRVGLFSSNPPVTRVVLDLTGPQNYQVFPSGRTVIVKVGGSAGPETASYHPASGPQLVTTNYSAQPVQMVPPPPPPPKPPLLVLFHDGLLSISSDKASLSEILFAVHQRTGAEIAIPAGAEQEKVAAELGPAPAPEVLAHLLNGSKFNFLILSSAKDPSVLDQVILSSRPEGAMPPPRPQPQPQVAAEEEEEPEPPVKMPPPGRASQAPADNPNPDGQPTPPAASPEVKPADNNDAPN